MNDRGPVLLLTRPMTASRQFLAACEDRSDRRISAIISPIIEIVPLGDLPDLDAAQTIVVSSGNAVQRLGAQLADRRVVTIGEATAGLARSFGADAEALGETARGFLEHADKLEAPVLVCRGVHTRVDLADALNARGVATSSATIYDQEARSLTKAARDVLAGTQMVIVPVFSPRSAALLSENPVDAPTKVLAISAAVARAWAGNGDISVARAPTSEAMVDLVTEAL